MKLSRREVTLIESLTPLIQDYKEVTTMGFANMNNVIEKDHLRSSINNNIEELLSGLNITLTLDCETCQLHTAIYCSEECAKDE